MLVGLIADTHINDRVEKIPEKVFEIFKDVELIIHAGDLTSKGVIDDLEKIAPVIAIQGNMDRTYNLDLPKNKIINIGDIKIGVIHGEVYPRGDMQQLYYLALELDVDILVTGHVHKAFIENIKDILILNPGSPTVPRLTNPTVMLLDIEDGEVDINLVKIGKPVCSALNFKK